MKRIISRLAAASLAILFFTSAQVEPSPTVPHVIVINDLPNQH